MCVCAGQGRAGLPADARKHFRTGSRRGTRWGTRRAGALRLRCSGGWPWPATHWLRRSMTGGGSRCEPMPGACALDHGQGVKEAPTAAGGGRCGRGRATGCRRHRVVAHPQLGAARGLDREAVRRVGDRVVDAGAVRAQRSAAVTGVVGDHEPAEAWRHEIGMSAGVLDAAHDVRTTAAQPASCTTRGRAAATRAPLMAAGLLSPRGSVKGYWVTATVARQGVHRAPGNCPLVRR